MLLALDNKRNDIFKAHPERQIQRQLLCVQSTVGRGRAVKRWGRRLGERIHIQGLRLSSRHVRQFATRGDVCANCSAVYLRLPTSPRLAIFLRNAVCGSTTAPKNPKDFFPGPIAYREAVYCLRGDVTRLR